MFAQKPDLELDVPGLLRQTQRYFDATLNVLSRREAAGAVGERLELELSADGPGYRGRFTVSTRRTSEHDLADAREAERVGNAAGMSLLAERCPTIWDVEPVGEDSELARLHLCGILASSALGPVLPDDGSTLYGVRGAMERVARLLRSS